MTELMYLKDVTTLELDREKCVGCGMCMIVCPRSVFQFNSTRAEIRNRDACMECGACAMNCPAKAVSVEAGVGCAAAVINAALGRQGSGCCCVVEPKTTAAEEEPECPMPQKTTCC